MTTTEFLALVAAGAREANEMVMSLVGERKSPPVVCLCGSTRFMEAFFEAGWQFTLSDIIVLSVGVCKHAGPDGHGAEAIGQHVADKLDELHKRKIDLADAVFVLDVGGYVGKSTQGEIDYAAESGKPLARLTEYAQDGGYDLDLVDWFTASAFVHDAAYCPPAYATAGPDHPERWRYFGELVEALADPRNGTPPCALKAAIYTVLSGRAASRPLVGILPWTAAAVALLLAAGKIKEDE